MVSLLTAAPLDFRMRQDMLSHRKGDTLRCMALKAARCTEVPSCTG